MVRRLTFVSAIAVLLATCPVSAQERDSTPTFSVRVNLIKVPISVFDESGALVTNLREHDFILYENGIPQQIRSFGLDTNPVSVVLVIDTSATVEKEFKQIKEAAERFAEALSDDDRISIVAFSDEAKVVLDWTDDLRKVRRAVRNVEPGTRTALYDAMFVAAHDQLRGIEGRKAIILLTDCLNNQSSIGFHEAALSVQQSQASLYVVSKTVMVREAAYKQRRVVMLSDIYRRLFGKSNYVEEFFKKREEEMSNLSENTGGRCFFPSGYDQIPGVYAEVARELKSKFFLTYVSGSDKRPNTYHEISLEYLPPSSKITYRRGFYFEPSPIRKRRY
jgi:Ca-activated chloride channel family protein